METSSSEAEGGKTQNLGHSRDNFGDLVFESIVLALRMLGVISQKGVQLLLLCIPSIVPAFTYFDIFFNFLLDFICLSSSGA